MQGLTGPQGPAGARGLTWRGQWSAATLYAVDDAVESGGSAYICLAAHTNQAPPNAAYWDSLAAKGDAGAQGSQGAQGQQGIQGPAGAQGPTGAKGLTWSGTWSAATLYAVDDTVASSGSAYICLVAHANQAPPNAAYWSLLSAKGDTGATGAQGAQGPQGSQGATGAQGNQGATGAQGAAGPAIADAVFCASPQTAQTWTNMPAAQTELFGTTWARLARDLAGLAQFRVSVNESVAGFAGATFRGQFSTDGGTNWNNLESAGTGADLDVGTGTGLKVGAWGVLSAAAIADVQLRIVGQNGNGSADPAFRYIGIEFR